MKFAKLLKWIVKSIFFGILIVFLFNFIGSYINLNIPINIWSILLVGILRIPGLAILILLTII